MPDALTPTPVGILLGSPPGAANQPDRTFEPADQQGAVLAVLGTGADERLAAEFADENAGQECVGDDCLAKKPGRYRAGGVAAANDMPRGGRIGSIL